ncbi:MAG: peptidase E, partial [Pseudomonadota bacterium]
SLFGRVPYDWASVLLAQDMIYVGGGNTKSMLALWKAWGLDIVLKEAYERGTVLAGVSAGAICWFEQGLSDSEWPLIGLDCLGLLPGSCCPHFDSETDRPDVYRKKIGDGSLKAGIALDDHTAAHYIDGKLKHVIGISPGRTARVVAVTGEQMLTVEAI